MQYHKYSLTELENMMPWERDIYLTLLKNYIEAENLKRQQREAARSMARTTKKKITLNNSLNRLLRLIRCLICLIKFKHGQSQLNTIQLDLKRLIESLQVNFDSGVQNVQTQINEVTNVIVQEQEIKKSETDALEEQIFAQEDKLQKQVKGKKETSSDGNLMQKAMSSVKTKNQ